MNNTAATMKKLYYGFKVAQQVGLDENTAILFVEFFMRFKPHDLEYRYNYVTEVAQRFKNGTHINYFDDNCTSIYESLIEEGF